MSSLQSPPEAAPQKGRLVQDAAAFVARYHARTALVDEQSGWNLSITLCATDTAETVVLRILDGRVVEVATPAAPTAASACRIVVSAAQEVLSDVLQLRRLANEPYLYGELLVQGPEPDFLRLDYIVSTLGDGVA
jgi:hypothetical protein